MARFFVNRPIVAMVISIITVLVGLVAMSGLPIAQYPEVVPPMVQVTTTFVGASATDVEASVATPIEQKVNGVEKGIYMKSTNANDGTLTLKVSFEVGSNLDMDNVLTQNRVSEATPHAAAVGEELRRRGQEGARRSRCSSSRSSRRTGPTTTTSSRTTRRSTSTTRSPASRASARSTSSAAATTPCASGSGPTASRSSGSPSPTS